MQKVYSKRRTQREAQFSRPQRVAILQQGFATCPPKSDLSPASKGSEAAFKRGTGLVMRKPPPVLVFRLGLRLSKAKPPALNKIFNSWRELISIHFSAATQAFSWEPRT
eukprot:3843503-Pyramimonas_sp.AAC.1